MDGRWHLVKTAANEGVAAQEPPNRQAQAAHRAVSGDGDRGVLRAGGKIAATAGLKRMDRRGDPAAIEGECGKQQAGEPLLWGWRRFGRVRSVEHGFGSSAVHGTCSAAAAFGAAGGWAALRFMRPASTVAC